MDLVVIEAPGKMSAVQAAFRAACGADVDVVATRGHLAGMPATLWPVGISPDFTEHRRAVRDPRVVQRLQDRAATAIARGGRVLVATDADAEGDAIAWDVVQTLAPIVRGAAAAERVLRVSLRGLDRTSVTEALAALRPVDQQSAVPGRARAIVDRCLGAAFSGRGRVVGRVTTALLGAVARLSPPVVALRLALPAAVGRPFVARVPVGAGPGAVPPAVAEHLQSARLGSARVGRREDVLRAPPHMGDLMLQASDHLDLPVWETAQAMQRLYEGGRLSYPRSRHRVLGDDAMRHVTRMAREAGVPFDARLVPRPGRTSVHDAPHPLAEVPVMADLRDLGTDEAILVLSARGCLSAGVHRLREHPMPEDLADAVAALDVDPAVADVLMSADWTREAGTRWPGREDWLDSGVVTRRLDGVLLEAAVALDIGRPSTWAQHVQAFARSEVIECREGRLALSAKGQSWLAAAPAAMRDPVFASRLEQAFDEGIGDTLGEHWSARAGGVVRDLLPQDMADRVMQMLEADAGPRGRTVEAELERAFTG